MFDIGYYEVRYSYIGVLELRHFRISGFQFAICNLEFAIKKPRPLLPSAGHAHEKTKGSMLKDIKELEARYIINIPLTIPLCGKFLVGIIFG